MTAGTGLTLEVRDQQNETVAAGGLMLTPLVSDDYWAYRVKLSDRQAILGFPKFRTIGIGFAVEEDWNTNLPYTCGAGEIYDHIAHNKGDDAITREDCIAAIEMIQRAVIEAQFPPWHAWLSDGGGWYAASPVPGEADGSGETVYAATAGQMRDLLAARARS